MTPEWEAERPCRVFTPADDYWPAYVEAGYQIHAGHNADGHCNPSRCCVVASLDGLVGPVVDDDDVET